MKILDFGIAKKPATRPARLSATQDRRHDRNALLHEPGAGLGRKSIDFRTDLWSLGVVASRR